MNEKRKTTARDNAGPFLTARDAAAYLGISRITLYAYVKNGLVRAYKTKRRVYFRQQDLDDYIASWGELAASARVFIADAQLNEEHKTERKMKKPGDKAGQGIGHLDIQMITPDPLLGKFLSPAKEKK